MQSLWLIYGVGAAIAMWRTDGPVLTKLACAVLWPLGVAAAIVTITGLVVISLVAFPAAGAIVAAGAALVWLLAR